jgi:hypothetical protein
VATYRNSTVAETSFLKEVPGAQILGQSKGIQSSVEDSPVTTDTPAVPTVFNSVHIFRKILLRFWFITWPSTTTFVSTS